VLAGLLLIAGLAMLLRTWASLDDLWLDEVWQISAVRYLSWPVEVVTGHADYGNHLLYAWLIPPLARLNPPDLLYRLPALLFTAASLPLLALVVWQQSGGRIVAVRLALVLFGGSFFCVQYAGEVRGYSMLLFFILLTLVAQWQLLDAPWRRGSIALLWLGICLGSLAQILYIPFGLAPIGLWVLYRLVTDPAVTDWRAILRRLLLWYAAPGVFLLLLYWLVVSRVITAGASESNWLVDLARAYGVAFGNPTSMVHAVIAMVAVLLGLRVAMVMLWRRGMRQQALLYLLAVVVCPLATVLLVRPPFLPERYLLPAHLFWIIALAVAGGLAWAQPKRRALVVALATAYMLLNGWSNYRLITVGRGDYTGALRYMVDQSPRPEIIVGGDNDFRNLSMIDYYRYTLPPATAVAYQSPVYWPADGVDWYLIHTLKTGVEVPDRILDVNGNPFVLRRHYTHYGLSGWDWYLFQNERDAPTNASDTP